MTTIKTTEIDDKIADLYHEVVSELLAIPGLRMRSLVHELGELLSNPRGHKWYEATVVFTYDGTRYELAQRRGDTPGGWQIKLEREGYSAVYLKPPCSLKAAAHELAHSLHAGFSSCAEFAEAIGGKDDPPDTKVFTPQPAPLAELRKVMEFRGKSYRKRPIVIRAFRCKADRSVETLEGTMKASPGDWIIEGVQGEFYPCKDDIFRATYEEVQRERPKKRGKKKKKKPHPCIGCTHFDTYPDEHCRHSSKRSWETFAWIDMDALRSPDWCPIALAQGFHKAEQGR